MPKVEIKWERLKAFPRHLQHAMISARLFALSRRWPIIPTEAEGWTNEEAPLTAIYGAANGAGTASSGQHIGARSLLSGYWMQQLARSLSSSRLRVDQPESGRVRDPEGPLA
jgi:hypothetical protein